MKITYKRWLDKELWLRLEAEHLGLEVDPGDVEVERIRPQQLSSNGEAAKRLESHFRNVFNSDEKFKRKSFEVLQPKIADFNENLFQE